MRPSNSKIANAAIALTLAACSGGATTAPNNQAGGAAAEPESAGATAASVDAGVDAGADDPLTTYCPDGAIDSQSLAAGVSAKGKVFTASFVQSTPNPPARYDNNWIFDFTDQSNAPIADLKMTKADTWMPYHGHGWPGRGTAMAQPGRFNVDINLNMPGYFRVDLDVASASMGSDHIEFFYCFR